MDRAVHKIDAEGKGVGRLATEVATLLRGKHKPSFAPYTDCGDIVEIYNTAKVQFTGKKWSNKIYYRHSGYPGGIKQRTAEEAHKLDPTFVMRNAVRGMLPDNKLRAKMMRRLKLHAESIEGVKKETKIAEEKAKEKKETKEATKN